MAEDNVVELPTQEAPEVDTSPEKIQEMAQQGESQVLQLVQKNRKEGHETLQRKVEAMQGDLQKIRDVLGQEPLMVAKNERGDTAFSLESTLRDIEQGMAATLTSIEAMNSLIDMLIYDLGGTVQNLQRTQQAVLIGNSHTQTLLELLKQKGIATEEEIKECWEELRKQKVAEAKAEMENSES